MADHIAQYLSNYPWLAMSVVSPCVVVISIIADRRRGRRANIEAVGFMPWAAISVISVLATVLSIALAIKSR